MAAAVPILLVSCGGDDVGPTGGLRDGRVEDGPGGPKGVGGTRCFGCFIGDFEVVHVQLHDDAARAGNARPACRGAISDWGLEPLTELVEGGGIRFPEGGAGEFDVKDHVKGGSGGRLGLLDADDEGIGAGAERSTGGEDDGDEDGYSGGSGRSDDFAGADHIIIPFVWLMSLYGVSFTRARGGVLSALCVWAARTQKGERDEGNLGINREDGKTGRRQPESSKG